VLSDAASSGDTLSITIDGQTNPYGEQSDKTVTSLAQGGFAIFDFDNLEGWADSGDKVYVSITTNGTATAKGFVSRQYQG